jgi:hypothetical protein
LKLIRKQTDADLIVSLLGPPLPTAEEKAQLPAKRARVIALCTGDLPRQVNLKSLFEDNVLEAAIVSRRQWSRGSPLSWADRSSASADAARPPRSRDRAAERSSSAATSSSMPTVASARCQARRSASASFVSTSAMARWQARRSAGVALWYVADRCYGLARLSAT